ncbi:MAG: DUF4783 domain-containing protein [Bacteroidales bacterium]|nr:DUF4783 domain-containing protein [Bacteroidales bacterium]
MRFIISTAIILFTFSTLGGITQEDQAKIPAGISLSIKTGNAAELAKYMNSTVNLVLLEKEDFYKKVVAETILKDFFSQYHAKDFAIRHQGARSDAQYAIGNLTTEKGNFRVYFLLKKVGNDLLIHQIRIEADNAQ